MLNDLSVLEFAQTETHFLAVLNPMSHMFEYNEDGFLLTAVLYAGCHPFS